MTNPMLRLLSIFPLLLLLVSPNESQAQSSSRSVRSSAISSAPIDSASVLNNLSSDLTSLLALRKEVKSSSVGVKVVSLRDGKVLYELNASKALTPASTTKILTTYSALLLFGSDYDIPTVLYTDAPPVNGVVKGNLYIKGHGDPLFSIGDVDNLIEQLKQRGIMRIEGDIIGDGTYFDDIYDWKDYSGDPDDVVDLPPVAGLGIENNMVTVVVSSPRKAGQLCNVQTFPASSGFVIVNSASSYTPKRSRRKSRRRKGALERLYREQHLPHAQTGRFGDQEVLLGTNKLAGSGISIELTTDEDGKQTVHVSGTLAVNKTVSKRYEIKNPPIVVAGMFYDRLRTHGVEITGTIRAAATPGSAVSLTEFQRPLIDVLTPVMKSSHNHYAEHVFKMIGAAFGSNDGVTTASQAQMVINQCMEAASAPFDKCLVNDGSGLSRRNLISADALVATLIAAYNNRPLWKTLYQSMSIAGKDGTLRKRMKETHAAGNAHGKTGTLRNVSALSGYVTTADGDMLAFAILRNGYNVSTYKSVENKIVQHLANFSWKGKNAAKQ